MPHLAPERSFSTVPGHGIADLAAADDAIMQNPGI